MLSSLSANRPSPKENLMADNLAYIEDAKTVHPKLTEHSRKMDQQVYQVADRVYLAVGYGLANCTMIEGDDGVVIIDVMESDEAARAAHDALRVFCDKPVKAVILTHDHADHIFGMHVFAPPEDVAAGKIEIYGHETLMDAVLENVSVVRKPIADRAAYSFGMLLPTSGEGHVNNGIGPHLVGQTRSFLPPTTTFSDRLSLDIAGLKIELLYAPSETDNEIIVWLPELKVLQSAEVIQGECYPNLHTIRGTRYRDPVNWYKTIDMMRKLGAEFLVPTHGRPVEGARAVDELLTAYRDAIQWTHDQAVRLINKGGTPDELAENLTGLPDHLKDHPWLGEYYGTVKHCVRQIYHGYLGWFEGDPTFLDPTPRREQSARYVELMGGRDKVFAAASAASEAADWRWAAELLTHLIRLDRDDMAARKLKAEALRRLGHASININWRNWYLTSALELEDALPPATQINPGAVQSVIAAVPTANIIESTSVRLKAEACADVQQTLIFVVTDTGEEMALEIRRGVAEFHSHRPAAAELVVKAPKLVHLMMIMGLMPVAMAMQSGQVEIEGDGGQIAAFYSFFEAPSPARLELTLR
jgi:linear primary-alkylsulfatase